MDPALATFEDQQAEWKHRYETRLAILGVLGEPTALYRNLAIDEANAALMVLTEGEWVEF